MDDELPITEQEPLKTEPEKEIISQSVEDKLNRLPVWIQFPRRVILLIIAYLLAQAVIRGLARALTVIAEAEHAIPLSLDWSVSWAGSRGNLVRDLIAMRLPNTLVLLASAMFLAFLLALVATAIAVLVHRLEEKTGPVGSVLKGFGRLFIFGQIGLPIFWLGMVLIIVLSISLMKLGLPHLPSGGVVSSQGLNAGSLGDRVAHLVLPSVTLALLPAAFTAQAVTREITLPREQGGLRLWLIGLFKLLGTLLGQVGGWLGAAVIVEMTFAYAGIGRLTFDAIVRMDVPLLASALGTFAMLVLIGRLIAELFRWFERLVQIPVVDTLPSIEETPQSWRKTARKAWTVLGLALLLIPALLFIIGLTVNTDKALEFDRASIFSGPSLEHPMGTDELGRDFQARLLRGAVTSIEAAALVGVLVLIPAGLGGALTGYLSDRQTWWSESLADVLLLPADILLFLPALIYALMLATLYRPENAHVGSVALVAALALLPRAVRTYQALWVKAPKEQKVFVRGVVGTGALFLGSLFAGLCLVAALDYLGFGVRPPYPSLGNIIANATAYIFHTRRIVYYPGLVLWVCMFVFYTAADALVGYFHTKEAIVRLNE